MQAEIFLYFASDTVQDCRRAVHLQDELIIKMMIAPGARRP